MATESRSAPRESGLRANIRQAPEGRTRHLGATQDKYFVPESIKQAFADNGWDLNWKRDSVNGMRDVEHQVALSQNGWEPVQADQAPGMTPDGYAGAVTRHGAVLMCRPAYLSQQAEQEALDKARGQVRNNERRLGVADHGQLPRTPPRVARDFVPPSEAERRYMKAQTQVIPE